jgi:ssDNA-binding Zn-finger/Zn-ribbon topoisomerase 1
MKESLPIKSMVEDYLCLQLSKRKSGKALLKERDDKMKELEIGWACPKCGKNLMKKNESIDVDMKTLKYTKRLIHGKHVYRYYNCVIVCPHCHRRSKAKELSFLMDNPSER